MLLKRYDLRIVKTHFFPYGKKRFLDSKERYQGKCPLDPTQKWGV